MKAGDPAQAMVDKHWVNVTIAPALPEHDDSVVTPHVLSHGSVSVGRIKQPNF
jgi:hypothetical protein